MSTQAQSTNVFLGTVEKIAKGLQGPYAVARLKDGDVITFSLGSNVWDGDDAPSLGEQVELSKLRKLRLGWRAFTAHRIKLTQEG